MPTPLAIESSAIADAITMFASGQNVGGGLIPSDATAVMENMNFAIPETFNYTQYLALKSAHVVAGTAYVNAKAQLATDQATYLTALGTYQNSQTATNNAAVVSALAAVNTDIANVNVAQQTWINLGTQLEIALGIMGQGV